MAEGESSRGMLTTQARVEIRSTYLTEPSKIEQTRRLYQKHLRLDSLGFPCSLASTLLAERMEEMGILRDFPVSNQSLCKKGIITLTINLENLF